MRSALHHASVADGTFEPRPGPTAAQMANQDWKNHRPVAYGSSTWKFILGGPSSRKMRRNTSVPLVGGPSKVSQPFALWPTVFKLSRCPQFDEGANSTRFAAIRCLLFFCRGVLWHPRLSQLPSPGLLGKALR